MMSASTLPPDSVGCRRMSAAAECAAIFQRDFLNGAIRRATRTGCI